MAAVLKEKLRNGSVELDLHPERPVFKNKPAVLEVPRMPVLDLDIDNLLVTEDPRARRDRLREAAVCGTPEKRVSFLLQEVFIHTPDVKYAIAAIEKLLARAKYLPLAGGMRLIAPGGMGKNALLRYFLCKYPPFRRGTKYCCPILSVDFRGYLSPAQVLMALLDQLDAVYTRNQNLRDLEDILLNAMRNCETIALFFNEAQHLLPVSRAQKRHVSRPAGLVGDWLKGFLDKIKRPTIFLGVTGWDEVFELDGQLGTRVPLRHEFSSFKFDQIFVGTLRQLDKAIPMPEPAGLGEQPLAGEIFSACKGNWRFLIGLLCGAILEASQRGSPRIERVDLSVSYVLQFGPHNNPFGPSGG